MYVKRRDEQTAHGVIGDRVSLYANLSRWWYKVYYVSSSSSRFRMILQFVITAVAIVGVARKIVVKIKSGFVRESLSKGRGEGARVHNGKTSYIILLLYYYCRILLLLFVRVPCRTCPSAARAQEDCTQLQFHLSFSTPTRTPVLPS